MSTTFKIRTLRDIFELPSAEQMECCLDEMKQAMIQARAVNDMLAEKLMANGITPAGTTFAWPDVAEWVDDGKGSITTRFSAGGKPLMSVVRTKEAKS